MNDIVFTHKEWKRFFDKVEVDPKTGCWNWTATKLPKGYGLFGFRGKNEYAHRIAWAMTTGMHPGEHVVRHKCDNPSCVNWTHLEAGTHADNMRDIALRHRRPDYKLTDEAVRDIRSKQESIKIQAARYGVSEILIKKVRMGTRRQHVG